MAGCSRVCVGAHMHTHTCLKAWALLLQAHTHVTHLSNPQPPPALPSALPWRAPSSQQEASRAYASHGFIHSTTHGPKWHTV